MNQVGRRRLCRLRHRRRGDIGHPRGMDGAGTVRVAHDQHGHPDQRGDRIFFILGTGVVFGVLAFVGTLAGGMV